MTANWYPEPLDESPAEIVEKTRLFMVYGMSRLIATTTDPETAAQFQRSGYIVEES